ncbi:hypothetical protein SRHO_G00239890 [Serrasalmus rhombeus]
MIRRKVKVTFSPLGRYHLDGNSLKDSVSLYVASGVLSQTVPTDSPLLYRQTEEALLGLFWERISLQLHLTHHMLAEFLPYLACKCDPVIPPEQPLHHLAAGAPEGSVPTEVAVSRQPGLGKMAASECRGENSLQRDKSHPYKSGNTQHTQQPTVPCQVDKK